MRYSRFEAAPADFAAAAPRLSEAADGLRAAFAAAEVALAEPGGCRGADADAEFEHGYHRDRCAAVELAAACEQALRDLARRLAAVGAGYAAAEDAAAERFGELALRLEALAVAEAVSVPAERR
jgi:hypothetical protein